MRNKRGRILRAVAPAGKGLARYAVVASLAIALGLTALAAGDPTPEVMSVSPSAEVSASPSGFLSAGTHPLRIYQDADDGYGQTVYGEGVNSRIQVSSHADGTQTQAYQITNLNFGWNIAGSTETVNVNELDIEGLLFRTPGKQWRPLTTAGLTVPLQTWTWTSTAVNSATNLSFRGETFLPKVEFIDGLPALVQQVRMTFTLTGDVAGTITLDQYEEIGTADRRRDEFRGSLTSGGGTAKLDAVAVLNGLASVPGLTGLTR